MKKNYCLFKIIALKFRNSETSSKNCTPRITNVVPLHEISCTHEFCTPESPILYP
ncbi:Protein CBG25192 [Caenorhabditis briggsae]|uniref:Protein CBG25192 n=1 Tax=Caenorhabditis briggsae TaxID=6238 RepID=B6IM17_CAEBR|nr:Protein CBG25192 [Caenorhabditis briggsae]CAS00947.1 Protein CBG25192 [Caenorhabditis briggsae]